MALFVVALITVSAVVGHKDNPIPPAPVSIKVAASNSGALVPTSARESGPASAPGTASTSASTDDGPRPIPTPAVLRSPGGNVSIALAPEDDPAVTALPSFIQAYPGARTISCTHQGGSETTRGSYVFTTPDGPDVVGSFYKDAFTDSGLVVSINVGGNDHKNLSYTLIADGGAAGRSVSLRIDFQEGRSHASIGFVGK